MKGSTASPEINSRAEPGSGVLMAESPAVKKSKFAVHPWQYEWAGSKVKKDGRDGTLAQPSKT